MEYENELNCSLISIEKKGKLTLREIGERLNISFVRVKQIEDKTCRKVIKRLANENITREIFQENIDYL
jgi:DNA-directed RNA polymerase sigma subunit (sigma70/sigma32)